MEHEHVVDAKQEVLKTGMATTRSDGKRVINCNVSTIGAARISVAIGRS